MSDYLPSTGFSFPPDGYGAARNPRFLTMDHPSTPRLPSGMANAMARVFYTSTAATTISMSTENKGFGQLQFSFPNT